MKLDLVASEFLDQEQIPGKLPSEGNVVKFHQVQNSPSGARVVETPLFIRPDLRRLFSRLNHFLKYRNLRRFYLSGPPGCGKTSFVTLWARMLAAHTQRRVLIINFREEEPCDVHVFHNKEVIWEKRRFRSVELQDSLAEYFQRPDVQKFHVCVVDGIRQNVHDCSKLLSLINVKAGFGGLLVKVVYVTSLAFRVRDMDVVEEEYGMMKESLDSWKFEGYTECLEKLLESKLLPDLLHRDALAWSKKGLQNGEPKEAAESEPETLMEVDESTGSDEFPLQLEDETDPLSSPEMDGEITPDVLTRYAEYKYFYAGGCARFMFTRSIVSLKAELDDLSELVCDWTPFTTTDIPSATSAAVNSLMQQFTVDGVRLCVAVSKYILMVAYEKCDESLIAAVTAIANATGNPSLQGWAFELQQLSCIKKVLKTPEDTSPTSNQQKAYSSDLRLRHHMMESL